MFCSIAKRLERPSARLVEFSVELDVLEPRAVYERAERIDRKVEQVEPHQQSAGDQRAQDLQDDVGRAHQHGAELVENGCDNACGDAQRKEPRV